MYWPTRLARDNEPGELLTAYTPRWWRIPRVASVFMPMKTLKRGPVKALTNEVDGSIALCLRIARARSGLRQCDLAAAVGMSASSLSRVERGQRSATVAEVIRLAVQLRVPLGDFLNPPEHGLRTGWERVTTEPLQAYWIQLAADNGEIPPDY